MCRRISEMGLSATWYHTCILGYLCMPVLPRLKMLSNAERTEPQASGLMHAFMVAYVEGAEGAEGEGR